MQIIQWVKGVFILIFVCLLLQVNVLYNVIKMTNKLFRCLKKIDMSDRIQTKAGTLKDILDILDILTHAACCRSKRGQ